MKCEDCRYGQGVGGEKTPVTLFGVVVGYQEGPPTQIICKRFPPVVVYGEVPRTDGRLGDKLGHAWKHPPVSASDWCGEFEEQEKSPQS